MFTVCVIVSNLKVSNQYLTVIIYVSVREWSSNEIGKTK